MDSSFKLSVEWRPLACHSAAPSRQCATMMDATMMLRSQRVDACLLLFSLPETIRWIDDAKRIDQSFLLLMEAIKRVSQANYYAGDPCGGIVDKRMQKLKRITYGASAGEKGRQAGVQSHRGNQ